MKIKTIEMDTDKFIKIQPNPIQRDTEYHSAKALKFHLSKEAVTHAKVSLARCGKIMWKLDGHTRAHLWKEGDLKAPSILSVDIYDVKSKEEAIELYRHFDNNDAAESNADKTAGALRLMGLMHFNSNFMRNTGLVNAAQVIHLAIKKPVIRGLVLELLLPWKSEIKTLIEQQWNVYATKKAPGTPSCVIAAFLITTKMYKQDCLGFWDGYYSGNGADSLRSGRDGSKAAIDWIFKVRRNEMIMGRHYTAMNTQALITAYQFYRAKKKVDKLNMLYKRNHNQSTSGQLGEYLKSIGFQTKF